MSLIDVLERPLRYAPRCFAKILVISFVKWLRLHHLDAAQNAAVKYTSIARIGHWEHADDEKSHFQVSFGRFINAAQLENCLHFYGNVGFYCWFRVFSLLQ